MCDLSSCYDGGGRIPSIQVMRQASVGLWVGRGPTVALHLQERPAGPEELPLDPELLIPAVSQHT